MKKGKWGVVKNRSKFIFNYLSKGKTQADIAKMLGITGSSLSIWIKRNRCKGNSYRRISFVKSFKNWHICNNCGKLYKSIF